MPFTSTGYQRSQFSEFETARIRQKTSATAGSSRSPGCVAREVRPRASHSKASGNASQAAFTRSSVA
ncbi:hypothetical protein D3C85_1752440 [compost metagenome]